jgi:hypothetical protein
MGPLLGYGCLSLKNLGFFFINYCFDLCTLLVELLNQGLFLNVGLQSGSTSGIQLFVLEESRVFFHQLLF